MAKLEHFQRIEKKREVLACMEAGDWRKVLTHFDHDFYHEPLLVWIRPDLQTLHFIRDQLAMLGIAEILSIGSGCAFLEWLISKACHPQLRAVNCLEVNATWWESNHATPHFMPLDYTEANQSRIPPKFDGKHEQMALMFCYFNNIKYFKKYLESYDGNCVILIGPVNGAKHCDPEPLFLDSNPKEIPSKWTLVATHNVRDEGEDSVAIYQRIF